MLFRGRSNKSIEANSDSLGYCRHVGSALRKLMGNVQTNGKDVEIEEDDLEELVCDFLVFMYVVIRRPLQGRKSKRAARAGLP